MNPEIEAITCTIAADTRLLASTFRYLQSKQINVRKVELMHHLNNSAAYYLHMELELPKHHPLKPLILAELKQQLALPQV